MMNRRKLEKAKENKPKEQGMAHLIMEQLKPMIDSWLKSSVGAFGITTEDPPLDKTGEKKEAQEGTGREKE